ncbi:O-antigen ligase family protein [Carnobacterium funditum]|uniref:O-antigen ligase family protein n=1 Tax=Carnobacterium funditum TaxID=2752 RepID=UPI000A6379C2|nr:O-antigen ligase family protein [Carnobacterium funditum]
MGYTIKNYREKITINKVDSIFLCASVYSLIGVIKTKELTESITFVSIFFIFTLLKIVFSNIINWKKLFLITALIFSGVHVFATWIQFLYPAITTIISKKILDSSSLRISQSLLARGKFPGITSQTGTNAFYITIFIAIIISLILIEKTFRKKIYLFILLILAYFPLLLTQKEGFLIINSLIIFVLFLGFIILKNNNKIIFAVMIILAFLFTFIISLLLFNLGFLHGISNIDIDEISSGRPKIYSDVWNMIIDNPFFGKGLFYVKQIIGINAHNIYLQLWAEIGLIGLVLFAIGFILNLYISFKIYLKISSMNGINTEYLLFSIYIQIFFIFYGIVGNPLYDYFMLGMYMIVSSIPMTMLNEHNFKTKEKV